MGPLSLPTWIDPEAWAGFVEMRRSMRKVPFTDRAAQMIVVELQRIKDAGHCPNAALDQSTLMGWRSVWPAKEKYIERAPTAGKNEWLQEHDKLEFTAPPHELKELAKKLRRVA